MILNIPDSINTLVHSIISSSPKIVSNSQKLNFPLDVSNAVERVVFTRIICKPYLATSAKKRPKNTKRKNDTKLRSELLVVVVFKIFLQVWIANIHIYMNQPMNQVIIPASAGFAVEPPFPRPWVGGSAWQAGSAYAEPSQIEILR